MEGHRHFLHDQWILSPLPTSSHFSDGTAEKLWKKAQLGVTDLNGSEMHINSSHWLSRSICPLWTLGPCTQQIDSLEGHREPWLTTLPNPNPRARSPSQTPVKHRQQDWPGESPGLEDDEILSPPAVAFAAGSTNHLHYWRLVGTVTTCGLQLKTPLCFQRCTLRFIFEPDEILFHRLILQCLGCHFVLGLGISWGARCPSLSSSRQFHWELRYLACPGSSINVCSTECSKDLRGLVTNTFHCHRSMFSPSRPSRTPRG